MAEYQFFINNLNDLPISTVTDNAHALFVELTQTAQTLQQVSNSLKSLVDSANDDKLTSQLVKTLKGINTLSQDFSSGSQGHNELRQTLRALTDALGELKPLLNQLNSRPNSLIFNQGQADVIEPKKKTGAKP